MIDSAIVRKGQSQPLPLLTISVGLAAYASVLAGAKGVLADQDTYLHVAVGRWIIAHATVPHSDVFSNSMSGAPWVPHEWLAEVALAWIFDHLGWIGLVVATGLAVALAIALLMRALLRYLDPMLALAGAVLAWGLCHPHLLARPHVFTFPLLVLWVDRLIWSRHRDRAPPLLLLPAMVLWANLHASFVLGILFAALLGAEAVFEASTARAALRAAAHWGGFLAITVVAALATPNGLAGLQLPFHVGNLNFALAYINEWQSPNFQKPQPLEAWLLLALLGILYAGVRLPIPRIAMLLLLIHLALTHQRHGEVLGLVAPLLAAPALGAQLNRARLDGAIERLARIVPAWLASSRAAEIAAVALLVLGLALTATNRNIARGPGRVTPSNAVAFAEAHHVTGNVYNDYEYGGYLIFSGIAHFIDGRADMYGDAFVMRAASVQDLPAVLQQYRIGWTLLPLKDPRVTLLDYLPGWRRVYGDDIAVVHEKSDAVERQSR